MTGKTPETFEAIVVKIYIEVTTPRRFPQTPLAGRRPPIEKFIQFIIIFKIIYKYLLIVILTIKYIC